MLVLRARAQLRAARGTIFKFTAKQKNLKNGNNNVELYNQRHLSQAQYGSSTLGISKDGCTTPRCYCRSDFLVSP